jgi:hypothetical protein
LIVLLALVIALVLPFTALTAGGVSEGGSAAKPQLRVVDLTPFAVVGTGFRAGETVRVTVRAEGDSVAATGEAGATGRVAVRFPRMRLGTCPTYVIAARGDKGSRAGLRSVPRPCGIAPRNAP